MKSREYPWIDEETIYRNYIMIRIFNIHIDAMIDVEDNEFELLR